MSCNAASQSHRLSATDRVTSFSRRSTRPGALPPTVLQHLHRRPLLFAVEPLVGRDAAGYTLATQRLRDLANGRQGDAELWHYFAMFGSGDKEEGLRAARRAVELDRDFADAWQILGTKLADKGDVDE